ncbi:unnamed protein product [Moneuplotes crassus]|uniref:Uncharacterized protein n=1 Tax=Euplotes crassus TaxID=5936 RepID=A0AAD1UH47_EUPCR|nr:unnamed protein product [Moneuplotes crassus]
MIKSLKYRKLCQINLLKTFKDPKTTKFERTKPRILARKAIEIPKRTRSQDNKFFLKSNQRKIKNCKMIYDHFSKDTNKGGSLRRNSNVLRARPKGSLLTGTANFGLQYDNNKPLIITSKFEKLLHSIHKSYKCTTTKQRNYLNLFREPNSSSSYAKVLMSRFESLTPSELREKPNLSRNEIMNKLYCSKISKQSRKLEVASAQRKNSEQSENYNTSNDDRTFAETSLLEVKKQRIKKLHKKIKLNSQILKSNADKNYRSSRGLSSCLNSVPINTSKRKANHSKVKFSNISKGFMSKIPDYTQESSKGRRVSIKLGNKNMCKIRQHLNPDPYSSFQSLNSDHNLKNLSPVYK